MTTTTASVSSSSEVPHIEVSGLHKSYRDGEGELLHILKGIDLKVSRQAAMSIVGASGTGKSTFMHILGGLDTADEGLIRVDSQDLSQMSHDEQADYRNRKIGLVFQFHHLLQDFTALENIMMPLRIARMSINEAETQGKALLEEVGLGQRLHHRPAQLSGGEQQRVAIARALANSPQILLADEPTGNLDQTTGEQIWDLMMELNRNRGLTVIVITHNPQLAAQMPLQYRMIDGHLDPVT